MNAPLRTSPPAGQPADPSLAGRRLVTIVSDALLDDPLWLTDAKLFAYNLQWSPDRIRDRLAIGLERTDAVLLTETGERAYIDLEPIEQPDLKNEDTDPFPDWWKEWAKPVPKGIRPRVRREARERIRLIATVLSLIFWEAELWRSSS